jgi:hypothetical protein
MINETTIFDPTLHQSRESTKVVNRRARWERVHAAQAAARASLAGAILALACDDSGDSTATSRVGLGGHCASAASLDGDGGGRSSGVGVDVLETAGGEGGAVGVYGELLEVGHCLVAGGGRVDAEYHAFAAVDAVLLLAVEPCCVC